MLFYHSAPNPELCTKKTLLSPNSSCHTKSCRNVAHVHRINGSLYFHSFAINVWKFQACYHLSAAKWPLELRNACKPASILSSSPLRTRSHWIQLWKRYTPPECTATPIYAYNLPYHETAQHEHSHSEAAHNTGAIWLEKQYWAEGSWVLLPRRLFTLDHVSPFCLTAVVSHHFVATRRCRCLLQSVRVNVMPWWLLFVISGILAGGSLVSALSFFACTPRSGPLWFCWRLIVVCLFFGRRTWRAETILSYHNSLQQNCFTHKLEPVTSLWCVCEVVCVLCGSLFCFCLGLFLVCFLLFDFCSLCFGFCSWNVTRDLDYVLVLYQFTFAAITASAPARVN